MIARHGNDAVVKGLEIMLAEAKKGQAGYLFAVMVTDGAKPMGGWFGSPPLEQATVVAVEQMAAQWEAVMTNRTLSPREPSSADRVCYNVPASPLSYDFIHWLVDAEQTRILAGAPAPLKVGFWFGRDGKTGLENPWRAQMFHNVIRPSLARIGAVEDDSAAHDGNCKMEFGFKDVIDRARQGAPVPRFKAEPHMEKIRDLRHCGGRYITITLREAEQYPHRNSNMEAWLRFASYLKNRGERVIFVRDTARAHDLINGFESSIYAPTDLHYRAALYQGAAMNLFVSNGPATLAYFSDWRWMMFLKIEPDGHAYAPNTPKFWREEFGMEVGEQFPWARADQRIIWKGDSYENLVAAWQEVMEVEYA
jgi:hypothetical protein